MTADDTSPEPPRPPPANAPYPARPEVFDEAVAADGTVRPAWRAVIGWMQHVGTAELQQQERQAQQRIREDGVAYHVHDDPVAAARPWPLDLAPLVLDAVEWSRLEQGLAQRASVLELLLADLYGPQRAVREGVVPAELVYGVPAYLRACETGGAPRAPMLNLYAGDLVRTAAGEWRVLADRTQAPAGLGFALENRVVTARVLADPFAAEPVHRLAAFFREVRLALAALGPRGADAARIALLTPGPGNETYFENAYLAHYLGLMLVEAEDLVAREDGVFLKMLGGLQQVDVVLRRIDDHLCDPLELRADSLVGVPGLVGAVRRGQVAVANALGAGLLATPALLSFLPAACRYFLGEDLRLPSVEGWWCGERAELDGGGDGLAVYDVGGPQPSRPLCPGAMSAADRAALQERVRAQPGRHVAQRLPALGTLPQLDHDRLEPSQGILRTFLVQRQPGSFQAMPGGLYRTVESEYSAELPVYTGRTSKDVWVRSDGPVDTFSLLAPAAAPVAISRGGGDLPSRVADHLFWLGRYKERIEAAVRVLRVLFQRLGEGADESAAGAGALRRMAQVYPLAGIGPDPRAWAAAQFDPQAPDSLRGLLDSVQRNAGRVRDRFSADTWRVLNRLFVEVPDPPGDAWLLLQRAGDWFNTTIMRLSAFDGLTMESMTRGPGWHFLDLGRRIERALHMSSLAGHAFDEAGTGPIDVSACEDVLSIADSLITYRRRYLTRFQPAPLLDLLLADETNPRSVAHQVDRLREHLARLPGVRTEPMEEQGRLLDELAARLQRTDFSALGPDGSAVRALELQDLLLAVDSALPDVSDLLTRRYFSHSEAARPLATLARAGQA